MIDNTAADLHSLEVLVVCLENKAGINKILIKGNRMSLSNYVVSSGQWNTILVLHVC